MNLIFHNIVTSNFIISCLSGLYMQLRSRDLAPPNIYTVIKKDRTIIQLAYQMNSSVWI